MSKRRSIRSFRSDPMTLLEVSQILWAAQGITRPDGGRTAPSAGATYPLEVYLFAGEIRDLPEGIYKYRPEGHQMIRVAEEDRRAALAAAARGQQFVTEAPVAIVIAAVLDRTAARYGRRAPRYVHMEAGHAAQNVDLQAVALGLGTVMVGAYDDDRVREVVGLPAEEDPLYILPVGRPR